MNWTYLHTEYTFAETYHLYRHLSCHVSFSLPSFQFHVQGCHFFSPPLAYHLGNSILWRWLDHSVKRPKRRYASIIAGLLMLAFSLEYRGALVQPHKAAGMAVQSRCMMWWSASICQVMIQCPTEKTPSRHILYIAMSHNHFDVIGGSCRAAFRVSVVPAVKTNSAIRVSTTATLLERRTLKH